MGCMIDLAKQRAAMVACNIDFTNNGVALQALPAALQALNATFTRASVKNVLQNGALVQVAANTFATEYDSVTGLYGYVPEPAATQLCLRTTLEGGGAAPTGWTQQEATGTSAPVASTLGAANGAVAYLQTATAQRPFISQTFTADVNTTYTFSFFVESVSGGLTAEQVIGFSFMLAGASRKWPACEANPSGIGGGIVQAGRLVFQYTVAGTGGVVGFRAGVGSNGAATGSLQFSRPQLETGTRATTWIANATAGTVSRAADVLSVPLWINNLKDSQDGSTANWSRSNCAVTTSGTAPDGTATAQLITVATTASTTLNNPSTKAPSTRVTYSIYVKQGNRATCTVLLRNHTTTTNFTSGILTYATNSISGTGWSVEVLPDGWYRCIYVSQISDVINVGDTLYGYAHFNGASFTAGDTAYLWGAQIEAGSTATTYRPTTSTLESAANANIPGFSSAGYTLFADGRFDTQHGVSVDALRLQTDANNYVRLNLNSSNNVSMFSYVSSAVTGLSTNVAAGVARNKFAGSFVANQFYFAVNGASKTNTSGALPAAPTTLFIGNPTQFNGFIFRAGIVPVALTQAQINGLTS